DVDRNRTRTQQSEHGRVGLRRMEQRVPAARIERARHIDQGAGAVQRKPAGPLALDPRQEALCAPAPNQPLTGRFRFARRTQLPKRLEERHHGAKIAGIVPGHIPVPLIWRPIMTLFDLSGRVAVVTGGNGGIGLGMARGLAAAGATIVVAARNSEKGEGGVASLTASGGEGAFMAFDVADEGSCRAMIEETVGRFGRLDILVNNAGTSIRKPPESYTAAEGHTVVDTNLTGALFCSQAAYPAMKQGGGGKIINIGSMYSIFGTSYGAAYAASKGALVQL